MSRNPLAAWLDANHAWNQNRLAKACGTSRQYVHQIVQYGAMPNIRVARAIAKVTDGAVPVEAWHERWVARWHRPKAKEAEAG